MKQRQEKPFGSPSVAEVKEEIDEVLRSSLFKQAPKLRRLLDYICQKSILLEGDKVTEYTIAIDVLGKPSAFKESRDSSVRVEVYRLRKRLAQFYEGDGHERRIRIVLPQGHYCPEFVYHEPGIGADTSVEAHPVSEPPEFDPEPIFEPEVVEPARVLELSGPAAVADQLSPGKSVRSRQVLGFIVTGVAAAFIVALFIAFSAGTGRNNAKSNAISTNQPAHGNQNVAGSTHPATASGISAPVRILAGYSGPPYRDMAGAEWGPDRFFAGGRPSHTDLPRIGRTYDQRKYENSRIGDSAYDIPLPPGAYEVHLYFMEHEYAPEVGRGENDRTFFLHLNDRRIEPAIDIESDAMGPYIADERVFKGLHPGANGKIHIALESGTGVPLINAIEIVPGLPHAQLPIRLIPQRAMVTDHLGNVWRPDQYSFNGQICPRNQVVSNTSDPELFLVERYGHFDYAIPVDSDSQFTVNFHFAEFYFGPNYPGRGGVGSRVFNVIGDGILLFPKLDIFAEVGSGRALIKSAHHIKPSAQGKLNLTFEPVVNYALIDAIEVIDESQ